MERGQLLGRDAELAVGRAAVANAGSGRRHLVYVGRPGAGKTAILDALADAAEEQGAVVLRAGGAQAEAEIPFAGLSQLLRPALADAVDLPVEHQRVLDRVVRIGEPSPQADAPIAMAVLTLLEFLAREQTVVVVLDDLQWLDRASSDVLAFVGRRVGKLRLAVVSATREQAGVLAPGASVVELLPLRPPDAKALLDEHADGLDPDRRAAILQTAEGNPLALVELSHALRREASDAVIPDTLPLTARIQQSFASRLDQLTDAARALLLLAACLESGELAELAAAARDTGLDLADLDAAEDLDLITLDGQTVRFTHRVVVSVVIARATPAQLRSAHAVLARILRRQPGRALLHRAAAATVADEALAAELEEAAAALAGPGDLAGVIATLDRAAAFSLDPTARARRLASAADAARAAGRYRAADARLARIDLTAADARTRLSVDSQRAWHQFDTGDVDTALGMLVNVLERGIALGRQESIRPAALAGLARWLSGNRSYDVRLRSLLRDLDSHLDAATPALGVMALAAAAATRTPAAILDALHSAAAETSVQGASRMGTVGTADTRAGELARLADAALIVDAIEPARALSRLASDQLRALGSFGGLATALASRCHVELCAGDWATATSVAHEALDLAAVTGQQRQRAFVTADLAYIAAAQGRTEEAQAMSTEVHAWASPGRQRLIGALAADAALVTALAAGDAAAAAQAISAMRPVGGGAEDRGALLVARACPEVVEGLLRAGQPDDARDVLLWVDARATRWQSPTLLAHAAHARAIVTELTDAAAAEVDATYERALALAPVSAVFDRGRLGLHYGGWLRRSRRPSQARAYLSTAEEAFDGLGAVPWADRARAERRATGQPHSVPGPSERRVEPAVDRAPAGNGPDGFEELTSQEQQVVQLAAEGLSNRQIGERLYLSPRTVGSHLYKAFPKLGVSNRAQLRAALDRHADHAAP